MGIRGDRRCQSCGTRWSYFDSGSIRCPNCDSPRSVAVAEDPDRHTDRRVPLDLEEARDALATGDPERALSIAADRTATYIGRRGFVREGALTPLQDPLIAAYELRYAATLLTPPLQSPEEDYLIALLQGAEEGERPPAETVPNAARNARGLASAAVVLRYRRAVVRVVDLDDPHRRLLERIRAHATRIEALDGAVEPETADALVTAMGNLGTAIVTGDAGPTEQARSALERLDHIAT